MLRVVDSGCVTEEDCHARRKKSESGTRRSPTGKPLFRTLGCPISLSSPLQITSWCSASTMEKETSTHPGVTLQHQPKLPRLPVPALQDSLNNYIRSLEGLQDTREHDETRRVVAEFLKTDGPRIQQKLVEYAANRDR